MSKAEAKRKGRERDETLYNMRRGGMTVSEIARRRVDVSEHQIRAAIERHTKLIIHRQRRSR